MPLVVLDEITRHRGWRKYVKGIYDRSEGDYQFLLIGSSRMDHPQRRGDSLAGRYYLLSLWPFTQAELGQANLTAWEEFFGNPLQVSMERQPSCRRCGAAICEHSGFPGTVSLGAHDHLPALVQRLCRAADPRGHAGPHGDQGAIASWKRSTSCCRRRWVSPCPCRRWPPGLQVAYNTMGSWLCTLQRFFAVFSLRALVARACRARSARGRRSTCGTSRA